MAACSRGRRRQGSGEGSEGLGSGCCGGTKVGCGHGIGAISGGRHRTLRAGGRQQLSGGRHGFGGRAEVCPSPPDEGDCTSGAAAGCATDPALCRVGAGTESGRAALAGGVHVSGREGDATVVDGKEVFRRRSSQLLSVGATCASTSNQSKAVVVEATRGTCSDTCCFPSLAVSVKSIVITLQKHLSGVDWPAGGIAFQHQEPAHARPRLQRKRASSAVVLHCVLCGCCCVLRLARLQCEVEQQEAVV